VNGTDSYILSCPTWDEFYERTDLLSKSDKGDVFERLVQLYLQNEPEYQTILQDVWLRDEVPPEVRKEIKLEGPDEGIDLIARTRRGQYWSVQAKFIGKRDTPPTLKQLATWQHETWNTCRNINLAYVAHTSSLPIRKRRRLRDTREIGLDRWLSADWSLIRRSLKKRQSVRPKPRRPYRHQAKAIGAAKAHFAREERGRLIMPCATGKSLTAFWIAEALKAKTIVVAVPSLSLIKQTVTDWTREFLAKGQKPDWVCVCSDESVGNLERDEFVGDVYGTGLPTHTDPQAIVEELQASGKKKIVFTTYQSSNRLAEAARLAGITFDLVICDEAHRTVGVQDRTFATLLRNGKLKARRRLFMTATERRVNGSNGDKVFSMDNNEDVYGKRFFNMTFKEAIDQDLISDYKILTYLVTDADVRRTIARNRLLNLGPDLTEAQAREVATGIALKRIFKKYGITHALSFHSSIRRADRFREQQDLLNHMGPKSENYHISSNDSAGKRKLRMDEFRASPRALMTNARCLQEGIDIPAIDCVVFADAKRSSVDIVQATGRAMRKSPGKKCGYILVPIVVPPRMQFNEFAATTAFKQVARILGTLSVSDTRIVDEFRALYYGHISQGKIIKVEGTVPIGMRMSFGKFADAIRTRLWENVARLNWRPFEEARAFVHGLGLKFQPEWYAYRRSAKRPKDIPSCPWAVYANAGWVNWSDWLGNGRYSGPKQSFEDARAFARKLKLRSASEWHTYCRSGQKPNDIPRNPSQVYTKSGWVSWGDWLGHDRFYRGKMRPFKKARALVRGLELKSQKEWFAYCHSGKKPKDIPQSPWTVYRNEWIDMFDWLGESLARRKGYRPFKAARAFVHRLGVKTFKEWCVYCDSGEKPNDIPKIASGPYANDGWIDWADWLGSNHIQPRGKWRPFKKARTFARRLGLQSNQEWRGYCRSGKKPYDIPANPPRPYTKAGWVSWNDWLGT
jgi:superfamily II DNA or RNA helicase